MVEKHNEKFSDTSKKTSTMSEALEKQLRSMHVAFLDRNEGKGKDAVTADKFIEFVSKQAGGKNLLSRINSSNIKVFFNDIQEKGTSLSTLDKHSHYFQDHSISQSDAMDRAYNRIQKNLDMWPGKWDSFVREHNLSFSKGINGLSLRDSAKSRTDIRTLSDLHNAWNSFIAKEKISHPNIDNLLHDVPQVNTSHIMMQAIYQKTRTKLQPDDRSHLDSLVGRLDAYSDIQTVDDMVNTIITRAQNNRQTDILEHIIIRNRDIYNAYQHLGGTGTVDGDFSQWDGSLRRLMDANSTLATTSTYQGSVEYIQDTVTKSQKLLAVLSPTIASLTEQYPMDDDTLRSVSGEYNKRIDELQKQYQLRLGHTQEKEGDDLIRAKEAKQQLHRAIEELRWRAWVESIRTQDNQLAQLLEQGPSLDFDFSKLSKEDQCYLGWCCARGRVENIDATNNAYGLDPERYRAFVRDMFDPQQSTITIPVDEGENVTIPVKDKGFLAGGVHPSHLDFKKIEECKHLGFGIDVEVTDDNEKAMQTILPHLFEKVGEQSLSPSYRVRLTNPHTGDTEEGYLMNIKHTDDEVKRDGKKINNPKTRDQWVLFDFPPTKAGRKYPTPEIIREGTPINNINDYDIDILDKNLTLTGDSLDNLAMGWALGDRIQHPQHPDQKLDSKWEDMMDEARTPDPESYIDDYQREQQQTDNDINSTEIIQENFLHSFKDTVKAPDGFFNNINTLSDLEGHKLWIHDNVSNVPPKTVPFWMTLTIDTINEADGTISFTIRGTDNEIEGIEGKSYTLPLESKTLRQIESGADDKTIHLMPDYDGKPMGAYLEDMQSADLIDKSNTGLFGGLELTDKGFTRTSDGKEVAYFAAKGSMPNPKDESDMIDIPYAFRVERSGDSFVISNKDLSYRKTVDFPTLLLFIGNRKLQAMTADEKKNFDDRTLNPDKYERASKDLNSRQQRNPHVRQWYSLATVISFVKNSTQAVKDGIENYNKKQTEDLTDTLLEKYGLYSKLASLTGSLGLGSMSDAFGNMHGDFIQERDGKVFKLITGMKDYLTQNPDGDTVVNDNILDNLKNAQKDNIPTKRRDLLNAAGKYLYMLEEHGDPYGQCLAPYRGSGLWVKILCGKDHYNNYLQESERVRLALEADPTNVNLLEEYADMEAKYIHQVISDNPTFKTFYSKQFADAIIASKWKGNEPARIDKTANIFGSQKDFDLNETLFGVKIRQGDIGKTVGHLKAMAMTAQSSTQINKVRLYLLELILSGMVLYQTNDVTKNTIIGIASKMGFIPGTWVKDANQQKKIHILLDYITGGNFSSQTGYADTMFQRLNYGEKLEGFHKKFKKWANGSDGKKVSEFLTLMDVKDNPDTNLLSILGQYHENNGNPVPGPTKGTNTNEQHIQMLHEIKEGIMNNSVAGADRDLQNKYLFTAPLAIPNSVIGSQLSPDRQGQLESGNNKETAMKEQFWKSLAHSIPGKRMPHSEKFFIEKFMALLSGITNHSFMQQAILSAQYHIQHGEPNIAKMILTDTMKVLPISKNMNNIDDPIQQVLDNYVDFFMANLGEMTDTQVLKIFNLGGGMDIDGSVAKPFDPTLGRDKNRNQIPQGSLNYMIYNLKQFLDRNGYPWTFFGGTGQSISNKKTPDQLKKIHHKKPVIENPEIYGDPAQAQQPEISTQEKLQQLLNQESDDGYYRDNAT